jgi:hypothetical protein
MLIGFTMKKFICGQLIIHSEFTMIFVRTFFSVKMNVKVINTGPIALSHAGNTALYGVPLRSRWAKGKEVGHFFSIHINNAEM